MPPDLADKPVMATIKAHHIPDSLRQVIGMVVGPKVLDAWLDRPLEVFDGQSPGQQLASKRRTVVRRAVQMIRSECMRINSGLSMGSVPSVNEIVNDIFARRGSKPGGRSRKTIRTKLPMTSHAKLPANIHWQI